MRAHTCLCAARRDAARRFDGPSSVMLIYSTTVRAHGPPFRIVKIVNFEPPNCVFLSRFSWKIHGMACKSFRGLIAYTL